MVVLRMFGRVLMDREALAQWTGRSPHTIRACCTVVGKDRDGRALYNAEESAELLADIPIRNRRGQGASRRAIADRVRAQRIAKYGDPEAVGYHGVHARIRRARGLAESHSCTECGDQAADWAYDHDDANELVDERKGPYSQNPDHYRPMCRSCHKIFDAPYRAAN